MGCSECPLTQTPLDLCPPSFPLLLIVFSFSYYLSDPRAYLSHGLTSGTIPEPLTVVIPSLGLSVNYYGSPLPPFPASPNTLLPPPYSSRSSDLDSLVGSAVNRQHSHRPALTSLVGSAFFRLHKQRPRFLGLSWSLSHFDECFFRYCLPPFLPCEQSLWFNLLAFS